MTAGSGVMHEEFHSPGFAKTGGPFRMVQLWVNLPARDKGTPAKYQTITRDQIGEIAFTGGRARIIAGQYGDVTGPASTFTPMNLWDIRLDAGTKVTLPLPQGHTSMIAVLSGYVTIAGSGIHEAEIARLSRQDQGVLIEADGDTMLLVMTGEPIDEPVFGRGPFVMNSEAEIREVIAEFNAGKFGALARLENG